MIWPFLPLELDSLLIVSSFKCSSFLSILLVITIFRFLLAVKCILPDVPLTSVSSTEICQQDAYVFLIALSVSYLIRFASSPESNRSSGSTEPLSWPSQPLCLLSPRLLPTGLQRKCWIGLCSRSTDAVRFLEQLRFAKSTHEIPSRLALRVAKAISSLRLPSSNAITQIWEFGLTALVQSTEFTRFNSPVLKYVL